MALLITTCDEVLGDMRQKQIGDGIEITLAEPSSPDELRNYFRFRWQLLRAPWGRPPGSERDEFDEASYHLVARIPSGEPVGIGRVHFPSAGTAQIRYMATKEGFRRRGIGKAILKRLEQIAQESGARIITLNARESAVSFYEKLGYKVCRDGHTLFGVIKHKQMEKQL
jgi:ribosomal protein S18 acetylase RimI-like enzyme